MVTIESTLLYNGVVLVEWLPTMHRDEESSSALPLAGLGDDAIPPLVVETMFVIVVVRIRSSSSPSSTIRSSVTSDFCHTAFSTLAKRLNHSHNKRQLPKE